MRAHRQLRQRLARIEGQQSRLPDDPESLRQRMIQTVQETLPLFSHKDAILRHVGALLVEQNGEWAVQRARYISLESVGQLSDDRDISLPAVEC